MQSLAPISHRKGKFYLPSDVPFDLVDLRECDPQPLPDGDIRHPLHGLMPDVAVFIVREPVKEPLKGDAE